MNKIQDLVAYINHIHNDLEKQALVSEVAKGSTKAVTQIPAKMFSMADQAGAIGAQAVDASTDMLRATSNVSLKREELDALVRNLIYQHQFTKLLDSQADTLARYILQKWKERNSKE